MNHKGWFHNWGIDSGSHFRGGVDLRQLPHQFEFGIEWRVTVNQEYKDVVLYIQVSIAFWTASFMQAWEWGKHE